MGIDHSWVYIHIINTKWFVWGIVIIVSALNIVGPIILWLIVNGKPIPFISKISRKNGEGNDDENKQKKDSKKPLRSS